MYALSIPFVLNKLFMRAIIAPLNAVKQMKIMKLSKALPFFDIAIFDFFYDVKLLIITEWHK